MTGKDLKYDVEFEENQLFDSNNWNRTMEELSLRSSFTSVTTYNENFLSIRPSETKSNDLRKQPTNNQEFDKAASELLDDIFSSKSRNSSTIVSEKNDICQCPAIIASIKNRETLKNAISAWSEEPETKYILDDAQYHLEICLKEDEVEKKRKTCEKHTLKGRRSVVPSLHDHVHHQHHHGNGGRGKPVSASNCPDSIKINIEIPMKDLLKANGVINYDPVKERSRNVLSRPNGMNSVFMDDVRAKTGSAPPFIIDPSEIMPKNVYYTQNGDEVKYARNLSMPASLNESEHFEIFEKVVNGNKNWTEQFQRKLEDIRKNFEVSTHPDIYVKMQQLASMRVISNDLLRECKYTLEALEKQALKEQKMSSEAKATDEFRNYQLTEQKRRSKQIRTMNEIKDMLTASYKSLIKPLTSIKESKEI